MWAGEQLLDRYSSPDYQQEYNKWKTKHTPTGKDEGIFPLTSSLTRCLTPHTHSLSPSPVQLSWLSMPDGCLIPAKSELESMLLSRHIKL